ncbi:MAG: hypothetical protein JNK26_03005 [Candidatus Doudnabacteria bacterium]|nr:hypothetical protein [Candidatus Doudnabacteria bacterium]
MPKDFTHVDLLRRVLTCLQGCNLGRLSQLTPLKFNVVTNTNGEVAATVLFRDPEMHYWGQLGKLSIIANEGVFLELEPQIYWLNINTFDDMEGFTPFHTADDDKQALPKEEKDKIVMDQAFDHLGFLQEARTFIEESIPNDEGLEECMRSAMEIGDWLFYSFDDRGIVDFPGEKYARLIVESLDYEIKTGRYRKGRPLGYRLTNRHNIFYAYFEEEGVIYRYTVIVGELYVYVDRLPYLVDNLEQDGFIPYDSEEEF